MGTTKLDNRKDLMNNFLASKDSISELVQILYQGILGRAADPSGLEDKVKHIQASINPTEGAVNVVADLLRSDEYRHNVQPKGLSTQEFMFPSRLQFTPTPINRILLVGSCLTTEFSNSFESVSGGIPHDFILFNNAADLPDELPSSPESYTAQLLQIPLRSVLTDRIVQFKDFIDQSQQSNLFDYALNTIDVMLEAGLKYQRIHNIPTFVTNFIIPFTPIASCLKDEATSSDISEIIRRLNEHVAQRVASLSNVYLIDLDAIAGALGKDVVLDDWFHIFSHNATFFGDWTETPSAPFYAVTDRLHVDDFRPSQMTTFYQLLWRAIDAKVRTIRQVDQVKLVVFDLDNTLWRGQIAEHYQDGVEFPTLLAWPEGLPEAIHHLRARGILVAICSKNDEEIVKERWERVMSHGWLDLKDFVALKINWKPKAVNIAEILEETSLTPKSVVFVDDNPIEREAVRTAFPNMRIIGENPFLTRSILLRAPEAQVAVRTQESVRREDMIRKQIKREHERAIMSRDEFLQGLACKVTVDIISDESNSKFARALELLNKTNQFNTTGKRWSASETTAFFKDGGELIVMNVADKFTDYGLVGVAMLRNGCIDQFVMSCRVLGLEIEQAVLSTIIARARQQGYARLRGRLQQTKDNRVCQNIYVKAGFFLSDGEYICDNMALPCPSHITLTVTH